MANGQITHSNSDVSSNFPADPNDLGQWLGLFQEVKVCSSTQIQEEILEGSSAAPESRIPGCESALSVFLKSLLSAGDAQ